jgi:RND family efflux transporter MFP subunit
MKIKKLITTIIAVALIVVLGIKGKGLLKSRQNEVANEPTPAVSSISVHLVKPDNSTIKNFESYLGLLTSDQSIKLSTKLAGFIEKIYVKESDVVKKEEPLVKIDSIELRSNIDALQANLMAQKSDKAVARSIYNSNLKLYKIGGLPKEKLELSRVALNAKRAMIENTIQKINQANHQLSYLGIKAPFDGVVDSLILQEGDLAATGKPILSLSNGKQKLLFSYSPTQAKSIKKGLMAYLDQKEIGRVDTIYTTSKNGLITAEIFLKSPLDLPIGSSVNIDILTNQATGCTIPQDSLLHKKDGLYVMVYNDKKFTPLKVDLKASSKDKVVISPCPKYKIAKENEVKLSALPSYKNVNVIGVDNE